MIKKYMNKKAIKEKEINDLLMLIKDKNSELGKEREEVLALMDILHYYESFCMHISISAETDPDSRANEVSNSAMKFAEKVCGNELNSLYAKQSALSNLCGDKTTLFYEKNKRIH